MSTPQSNETVSAAELIERWENVERVLVNMPEHERQKHWDMGTWGTRTACGTVACAAGHCGLDPWFRERGFCLDFVKCDCGEPDCFMQDISNVDQFFGENGANRIFNNGSHRSVETVIEEVRGWIAALKAQAHGTALKETP